MGYFTVVVNRIVHVLKIIELFTRTTEKKKYRTIVFYVVYLKWRRKKKKKIVYMLYVQIVNIVGK